MTQKEQTVEGPTCPLVVVELFVVAAEGVGFTEKNK
jgi:hypothetical protein